MSDLRDNMSAEGPSTYGVICPAQKWMFSLASLLVGHDQVYWKGKSEVHFNMSDVASQHGSTQYCTVIDYALVYSYCLYTSDFSSLACLIKSSYLYLGRLSVKNRITTITTVEMKRLVGPGK